MILNNKYCCARFSKIETLIQELIFVKNTLYAATIENDNGAVAMRIFLCDRNGSKNSFNFKKGQRKGVEVFLNCALTSYFFKIDGVVASIRVAQNETPKMANNVRFY